MKPGAKSRKATAMGRPVKAVSDEVVLNQQSDRLIVEPAPRNRSRLGEFLASLPPLGEGLPEIEDPPIEPEDIF